MLEYDDVMNSQRELIYKQRNEVLDGKDVKSAVVNMIYDCIDEACDRYLGNTDVHDDWNLNGLREYLRGWLADDNDLRFTTEELGNTSKEQVAKSLKEKADKIYEERENEFGNDLMREVERVILLKTVDKHWMEHIDAMDEMRKGIGLVAYGHHDPIQEYRNQGCDRFNAMTESIREETARAILSVRIHKNEEIKREKVAEETGTGEKGNTVRGKGAVSKNAPCPCGSGLKYKRCCGKNLD